MISLDLSIANVALPATGLCFIPQACPVRTGQPTRPDLGCGAGWHVQLSAGPGHGGRRQFAGSPSLLLGAHQVRPRPEHLFCQLTGGIQ